MDLYYCKIQDGNFGDDMNTWFWDALIPDMAALDPDVTLVGIGTIISNTHLAGKGRMVIAGSGVGYGVVDRSVIANADIAWVRGPRTAAALGLSAQRAITDPAAAVARLGLIRAEVGARRRLFIPHHSSANLALDWERIGAETGLSVVSPKLDSHVVIAAIAGAELVVTESMHGAILADAFRVPWIAVAISHHFNTFKWSDWAESVETPLHIHQALSEARAGYFAARRALKALRAPFKRTRARAAVGVGGGGGGAGGGALNFNNPDFLEQDERRFVKRAVAALHRPVERMLIRDLRRAMAAPPSLSPDRTIEDRVDRIFEAVEDIRRRYAA